ncbi:MAG TPA: ABC transporter ATP-binding protein [Campylobacterales bacterium]|nr:ABC transporter ATP-binding protein [Campylobacterales bacterium]
MIEVQHITKKFYKDKSLDDVSITFKKGDRVAIMGPNGAGKTTLVRAILGYYHVSSGQIRVNGFDPINQRVEVVENIGFIPQLPPPIKLSCKELIEYVSKSSGCTTESIIDNAHKMGLDIENQMGKSFFKLSGGMKQKLLIAIAVSKKSEILIFDEPTANLDPKGRESFYNLLDGIKEDKILLFITHRLDEIEHLVNRVVYMDLGKIVSDETL